ncbi:nuclear transport factor 2 family protein [Chelatococcus reniformis]|uniref:Polyketide cyclase n=1 Tax=Chelatococcus reniformis TaxID=1494448 RepID=A0A916U030_9HYPH|nr:nuclear transport factor 2 family protein [Chelatococcus reniformis]GGC50358.1 hypothetical protein GCM10010994_06870 [Chelatococcus reniformis]
MTDTTAIVDRYIDMWNETDDGRRRAIISRTWTDEASYRDPMMSGDGPDGIDAMVRGVQERFPGYRFRRVGAIDQVGDALRFSWQLAPEAGDALAGGTDFGVLAADGRFRAMTGFLDQAPAA